MKSIFLQHVAMQLLLHLFKSTFEPSHVEKASGPMIGSLCPPVYATQPGGIAELGCCVRLLCTILRLCVLVVCTDGARAAEPGEDYHGVYDTRKGGKLLTTQLTMTR